jgi:hypothetical protein
VSDDPAYLRQPGVNATEIDTETFLVGPEDGEVYYLDEVSSALWRFLEAPRRHSEIVATFAAAFPDVAPATLEADIDAALAELESRKLAVRRD